MDWREVEKDTEEWEKGKQCKRSGQRGWREREEIEVSGGSELSFRM